jgi:hypothetical protein
LFGASCWRRVADLLNLASEFPCKGTLEAILEAILEAMAKGDIGRPGPPFLCK